MTLDELYEYMDRDDPATPVEENDIPKDLRGMLLLRRLAPESTRHGSIGGSEHDIVYFHGDLEEVAEHATTGQLDVLLHCGFFINEDSFAKYV